MKQKLLDIAHGIADNLANLLTEIEKLPEDAPPPLLPVEPNTDDGLPLMQLGVGWNKYWDIEDKYINLMRIMGPVWTAVLNNGSSLNFQQLQEGGYIDDVTLMPKKMPANCIAICSGLFRFGAQYYPDFYAGAYVLEWAGEGTEIQFGFGTNNKQTAPATNRRERIFTSDEKGWCRVEITKLGTLADIKLYRKENEELLSSGEELNPLAKKLFSKYKILRTLDLVDPAISWVRKVDQLAKPQVLNWDCPVGYNANNKLPKGTPIKKLFDLAVQCNSALWLNIGGPIGAPDVIDDYEYYNSGVKAGIKLEDLIGQSVINSQEWIKYAELIVDCLNKSNYPTNRILYIELSNEVWEFSLSWRSIKYYEGIGKYLKSRGHIINGELFRYGLGYMTARFQDILNTTLKLAGRKQEIVYALAGQLVFYERTRWALQGYSSYFLNTDIYNNSIKQLGITCAEYFVQDAFNNNVGVLPAANEAAVTTAWLTSIANDPQGLKEKLTKWVLKQLPKLAEDRKAQNTIANSFNTKYIGAYEGGDHIVPPKSLSSNPKFVNFMEEWRNGPEGEIITQSWFDILLNNDPKAIISNYRSIGVGDPEGASATDVNLDAPWFENFWGKETSRTKVFDKYLRKGA